MRVRILDPAERDLEKGYHFYERQFSGLGSYFIDSLYEKYVEAVNCHLEIKLVHN